MTDRLEALVASLVVVAVGAAALGCSSASRSPGAGDAASHPDAADAAPQRDAVDPACAVKNAPAEAVAQCGVPPTDSDCCERFWCGTPGHYCDVFYPRGCCGCNLLATGGPQWQQIHCDFPQTDDAGPDGPSGPTDGPADAADAAGATDAGAD